MRRRGQPSPPSWRRSVPRPNGAKPRSRLFAASARRRPGIGFGKLAQPLRVALTGGTVSPGVFEIMAVLGPDETIGRIDDAARGRNLAMRQSD